MKEKIAAYLKAGYSGLAIQSYEEVRVQGEVRAALRSMPIPYQLHVWTCTKGMVTIGATTVEEIPDTQDPMEALNAFDQMRGIHGEPEGNVLLMEDFHLYVSDSNPVIIRRLKESLDKGKKQQRCIIVLGCNVQLCPELEKEFTVIEFSLPDREQLRTVLTGIAKSAEIELNGNTDGILDAASGLTFAEAENAFALSVVECKDISAAVVAREKAATIKKNGLLEIVETKVGRSSVGGLDLLMDWLSKRKAAYSQKAIDYGVPPPKGVLMVGIPGCGKSLVAKAIAEILSVPLLKLDCGKIFGSLVGQSEQNLRSIMQMAEAIAPCILYVDEVEKGLQGSKSSGQTDGGTSARVFGSFLQWMQEKTAPVFVVATSNDITALPMEFQRKGRFDEMFFIDLPDVQERCAIWKIQIQKYGRKAKAFNITELAELTDKWTGSEIESVFIEALYSGFDDNGREPTMELLRNLIKQVVPLSDTMAQQVDALRTWAKGKARRASSVVTVSHSDEPRKITT